MDFEQQYRVTKTSLEEEIECSNALRVAVKNIRRVLIESGAEYPLHQASASGLSAALAIVDAATLHLVPRDDIGDNVLIPGKPGLPHAGCDSGFGVKV